jgi:hypothetical protein
MATDEFLPSKPGYILNAGGPVWGIDWCPLGDLNIPSGGSWKESSWRGTDSIASAAKEYLALSTLCQPLPIRRTYPLPNISRPGMLQIWSVDATCPQDFSRATDPKVKGKGMRFELGICVDVGEAYRLKWCPKGGEVRPISLFF